MRKEFHKVYIISLTSIVFVVLISLVYYGFSYYETSLDQRFYHEDYHSLKPSGFIGHGLGVFGTLFILIGIALYMIRKRSKRMMRFGLLKHWLEFHIFLCTLGPIMILFHTSFKFGGLVSISFWSMVAVFVSGIIGRFIYLQIPRSIEGRELSLSEVRASRLDYQENTADINQVQQATINEIMLLTKSTIKIYKSTIIQSFLSRLIQDFKKTREVKKIVYKLNISKADKRKIIKLISKEISFNRKIDQLDFMKRVFQYWHVAHMPFAIVMITIMVIHVVIALSFGYKWFL